MLLLLLILRCDFIIVVIPFRLYLVQLLKSASVAKSRKATIGWNLKLLLQSCFRTIVIAPFIFSEWVKIENVLQLFHGR